MQNQFGNYKSIVFNKSEAKCIGGRFDKVPKNLTNTTEKVGER